MTKQEFLDRLRMSLHGKIPPGQVVENLQFYEDYINTEIRKGAAEEEVMAGLGDPRPGPLWKPGAGSRRNIQAAVTEARGLPAAGMRSRRVERTPGMRGRTDRAHGMRRVRNIGPMSSRESGA